MKIDALLAYAKTKLPCNRKDMVSMLIKSEIFFL